MNSGTVALREKAKLLDTVLDAMDQGLMMIDADGVVQVCNARALALLDLPLALMRSRPTFEAVRQYQIAQGEFGKASEALQRWVADSGLERRAHTYERERPNGTVLEIRTVPLPDGGAVRTFTDITARKRAEETLQVSETRLALAQDAGSDGLWDCDLTTGEAWSSDRWWGFWATSPANWRATRGRGGRCSTRRMRARPSGPWSST